MTKEEQIEEIAKDLCPLYKEYEECNTCDAVLNIGDEPCVYKCMAEMILDKGYRKASSVVSEFVETLKEKSTLIPTVYNSHFGRIVDQSAKEMLERGCNTDGKAD